MSKQVDSNLNTEVAILSSLWPGKTAFQYSYESFIKLIHRANMLANMYDKLGPVSSSTSKAMAPGTPVLLNATVVSMTIGIFEAQPHFRTILLQIQKLLAVESSTPLLSYELYCIFIFHSTFN